MPWSYDEALDYLYGFINYEVRREARYAPEYINLDRPLALLEGLGNPHRAYPIIHIAGTKGKGSVGAFCHASLQAAGLRTALYSSPHLQDFRERFRIDDEMIAQETFAALLEDVKPVADTVEGLTWFELTTGLAFLYFARQKVDAAVLEVGLGGRLDATNVVRPLVAVITSLSYDHMYLLGNTLAEIAGEKAGIIKPGVPVVSAPQDPEAAEVLARISGERNAPLTIVGHDWLYEEGRSTRHGQYFRAGKAGQPLQPYWTPLIGGHQAINGTVALAALDIARQDGLDIPDDAGLKGLRQVNWPGRFEIVESRPWLILDAAHNGASATWLAQTLDALFGDVPNRVMVFGAMADKDVQSMYAALLPGIDHLVLSQTANSPRAFAAEELAAQATAANYTGTIDVIPDVAEALSRARFWAGEEDLILVTGSVIFAGQARDVLGLPPGLAAYNDPHRVRQFQTIDRASDS